MPILDNARHEAFAQARAKGASPDDAYEDAGFAPGNAHGWRLLKIPEIAERVAELRALQTDIEAADTHAVVAALLRVAKASEADASPAALKEIRLTLLEAHRLRSGIANTRLYERLNPQSKC